MSHSQSDFPPERCTSDEVWTHKWLAAKTAIENVNIKITGIDMSAAFDTIDRNNLLQILETPLESMNRGSYSNYQATHTIAPGEARQI